MVESKVTRDSVLARHRTHGFDIRHWTVLATVLCLCLTSISWPAAGETVQPRELVIVENGASDYRIVIARDASVQENYAAQELQKHIEEMTGLQLPIVADDNTLVPAEIVVGFNQHTRRLAPSLKRGCSVYHVG